MAFPAGYLPPYSHTLSAEEIKIIDEWHRENAWGLENGAGASCSHGIQIMLLLRILEALEKK